MLSTRSYAETIQLDTQNITLSSVHQNNSRATGGCPQGLTGCPPCEVGAKFLSSGVVFTITGPFTDTCYGLCITCTDGRGGRHLSGTIPTCTDYTGVHYSNNGCSDICTGDSVGGITCNSLSGNIG
ncbi:unnamed protein product [Adineta steineri]|uniref:Uncharacterized protein n=1 Tax=Adineta steineri TaxID=433720 RepID=A0A815G5N5_9BILA|nr:unnamed protein product [Adineta steineri]CAF1574147.1 unnamed protein product [Adineta steineri]